MFGDVSAGGNHPISTLVGEWKSLVMETVLTAILVSVIRNTATGGRSIGLIGAAIAVMIIGAVRGLPNKEEREAAEGGDLPIFDAPSPSPSQDGH